MEKMKNFICKCIERKVVCNCFESFSSNVNAIASQSAQQAPNNQVGESSDETLVIPPLPESIPISFTWNELCIATQVYKGSCLAQGGFGFIYRCKLADKEAVAKVQRKDHHLLTDEFMAEVQVLGSANHPNVVKLLGKCEEDGHRALIYEFLSGGSVENYFPSTSNEKGSSKQQVLNWDVRQRISVGVAKALDYLHGSLKWVHSDIKAANVLLDNDFVPKLGDFGLAKRINVDENGSETQIIIDVIKGTLGWIAPETQRDSVVSTKSDVYSYGVFLLYLYTGLKPWDEERSPQNLADWFSEKTCGRENYERKIVDAALGDMYSLEGLRKIFAIAVRCIHAETHVRPTMNEVLKEVREASTHQPHQNSPVTERIS